MFPGQPAFTTTLTNGTSIAQGIFIEMFLTAELVFTVLMLAAEKSKATFIAPGRYSLRRKTFNYTGLSTSILSQRELLMLSISIVGIGLALFVAELAGMLTSGAEQHLWIIANLCGRRIFYWRIFEPYSVIWSVCCYCEFPRLPLDILAWPAFWRSHFRRILQVRQIQQLRGGKPWAG